MYKFVLFLKDFLLADSDDRQEIGEREGGDMY